MLIRKRNRRRALKAPSNRRVNSQHRPSQLSARVPGRSTNAACARHRPLPKQKTEKPMFHTPFPFQENKVSSLARLRRTQVTSMSPVCVRNGRERSLHRKSFSDALIAKRSAQTQSHAYMITVRCRCKITKCPRVENKRGVDLIPDALPFGRLWYTQVWRAIGYAEFRRRPLCDFQKKACGSGGARVEKLSAQSDKAAKRGWHTDIDRRRLVWKFGAGRDCLAGGMHCQ